MVVLIAGGPSLFSLPYDVLRIIAVQLHPHQVLLLQSLGRSTLFSDLGFAKENLDVFIAESSKAHLLTGPAIGYGGALPIRGYRHFRHPQFHHPVFGAIALDRIVESLSSLHWRKLGASYLAAMFMRFGFSPCMMRLATSRMDDWIPTFFIGADGIASSPMIRRPLGPIDDPSILEDAILMIANCGGFSAGRVWQNPSAMASSRGPVPPCTSDSDQVQIRNTLTRRMDLAVEVAIEAVKFPGMSVLARTFGSVGTNGAGGVPVAIDRLTYLLESSLLFWARKCGKDGEALPIPLAAASFYLAMSYLATTDSAESLKKLLALALDHDVGKPGFSLTVLEGCLISSALYGSIHAFRVLLASFLAAVLRLPYNSAQPSAEGRGDLDSMPPPWARTLHTCFQVACEKGQIETVRFMLSINKLFLDEPVTNDELTQRMIESMGQLKLRLEGPFLDPTCFDNAALISACSNGHSDVVSILLSCTSKIRMDDASSGIPNAFAALTAAADAGYVQIVDQLLEFRPSGWDHFLFLDDNGVGYPACPSSNAALQRAALWGHDKVVDRLLCFEKRRLVKYLHEALNRKRQGSKTDHWMTKGIQEALLVLLIQKGWTIPFGSGTQWLRLTEGLEVWDPRSPLNLLLGGSDGGDPENVNPDPFSFALMVASGEGHTEIVRVAMRRGREACSLCVGAVEQWWNSTAAPWKEELKRRIIQPFENANRRPTLHWPIFPNPAIYNSNPLRKASANGHSDIVAMLLYGENPPPEPPMPFVEMEPETTIKSPNADPASCNDFALRRSCENGHLQCVKWLLSTGKCNPAADNSAAFRAACRIGNVRIVEALLQADEGLAKSTSSKIDRVDLGANGNVAIQDAACNGHVDVVRMLLEASEVVMTGENDENREENGRRGCCDPSAQDSYALRMAAANGHADVVKLLLDLHWDDEGEVQVVGEDLEEGQQGGKIDDDADEGGAAEPVALETLKYRRERRENDEGFNTARRIRRPNPPDPAACQCFAIRKARERGHVHVVKVLEQFGLAQKKLPQ
ncbi:hypothetical protein HDU97_003142 [Phlyctochytrium planicorne]|nr:hypothetical protein HDU97_003142 [Phlyctochytrium planicorne]